MKDRVGVMAGTPIDTQMGVDLLRTNGIEAVGYPLSENPKEQSRLQLLSKDKLHYMVIEKILHAKSIGIEKFFIYCNSLSAAVDMHKVSKETKTFIVTPFMSYKEIAKEYSNLLILGANAQSCSKIEEVLEESNKDITMWSISALPLVEYIEKRNLPIDIYEKIGLGKILQWGELNNFDGIVLGCTHFPYLKEVLMENTNIPIIDPADKMVDRLTSILV